MDQLLALKAEFKTVTGNDYGPPPAAKPVEDKVVLLVVISNDTVDCQIVAGYRCNLIINELLLQTFLSLTMFLLDCVLCPLQ